MSVVALASALRAGRVLCFTGAMLLCAAGGTGAWALDAEVRIQGEKFIPDKLTVKKGTMVRWVNAEKRTTHSVHFIAEKLPESERMFSGESWTRRFDKPGVYPYICGPHPEMKGVIEVID